MDEPGYCHPHYAASLAEFGRPVYLPNCGGWVLVNRIPGVRDEDAAGCYPLFSCANWPGLPEDLRRLQPALVSLVLVADPFGVVDPARLRPHFSHGVEAYKEHTVIDLDGVIEKSLSPHHRRNVCQALRQVRVEPLAEPRRHLAEWCALYRTLIARHGIRGIQAFSRDAFARQLTIPGLVAFRAQAGAETVAMALWYVRGQVGYYHLAASSRRGYALKASYALFWTALEVFRGRLAWLNLGAGAGVRTAAGDGLTRFKRGWSPLTRTAYLCRHVFQPRRYAELCALRRPTDFFPAYRAGTAALAAAG